MEEAFSIFEDFYRDFDKPKALRMLEESFASPETTAQDDVARHEGKGRI